MRNFKLPKYLNAFTLIEILITLIVASFVIAGLGGIVGEALSSYDHTEKQKNTTNEAQFALERMTQAIANTPKLILPLVDNPGTGQDESVRDVLAVVLDPKIDRDNDGFSDADNDRDGRIDEDPDNDNNDDGAAGILNIDDDNDGSIDEGASDDDDEDGSLNEEILNGMDDDGDGSVDEDLDADLNQDGKAGIKSVDDDDDGSIDEGSDEDDDEDGSVDEDWYDSVVYFLQGTNLIERMPNPHATSGTDYTESVIAENVTGFQVTRLPRAVGETYEQVEIILSVQQTNGEVLTVTSVSRVGAY